MTIELGIRGEATMIVSEDDTALGHGTGDVDVLSTPALLQLMQQATMAALTGRMADGLITAGLRVNLDHLLGSPIGASITATATLTRIEGRRLIFEAEARSGDRVVGLARIIRVQVDRDRFLSGLT